MSWDEIPEGYFMAPVPFPGTRREQTRNLMSHDFGPDSKCFDCDCRFGSLTSSYPCGTNPPRQLVKADSDKGDQAMRASMGLPSISPEEHEEEH